MGRLFHEALSKHILGAAMAIMNDLKPGLDEKLYENARDRSLEVDFLIRRGQHMALFEAKWMEHPQPRDVQNLPAAEKYLRI